MSKKGVSKAGILVLLVSVMLFFVVNGLFGLALTTEEEKQQLEAELVQIEAQLNVISAGLGQDFGGLLCGVDRIKYSDYKCEHIGFHVVKVLTVGVHNQRFNFSDFIADAHNCLMVISINKNCNGIGDDILRIMIRINEIEDRLKQLEE